MKREDLSEKIGLGKLIPSFTLPATDGNDYSEKYFSDSKAGLLIFTCNHCPYVKGSEEELNSTIKKFLDQGLKVLAISSNDASQYPEDSFEKMKEKNLPYPYLYDETQQVAKDFDAACTPEMYLFDANQKLAFHGTVNNSPRHPEEANQNYLDVAITQVLAGEQADPSFINPMGCSIKWKQ